ncbi:aldo/keto reductase [Streptomyces sp. NPDC020845]|uniref:aldo/keto reductase n=1 Tax=Streptomyces sp. NPDC020845 TaxID=3365096 RepID=UPI0037A6F476
MPQQHSDPVRRQNTAAPRDEATSISVIHQALVLGVTLIDTADVYGPYTNEELVGPVEFSVYGPVTAVRNVLPGMRALGRGTVLFVNGGTAVVPHPDRAGTSIAFAAESAYGRLLHDTLAAEGIHVAQLIIPGAIIPGHAKKDPAALANTLWNLHQERNGFRHFADDLDS